MACISHPSLGFAVNPRVSRTHHTQTSQVPGQAGQLRGLRKNTVEQAETSSSPFSRFHRGKMRPRVRKGLAWSHVAEPRPAGFSESSTWQRPAVGQAA